MDVREHCFRMTFEERRAPTTPFGFTAVPCVCDSWAHDTFFRGMLRYLAQALLQEGADVNVRDRWGCTAMQEATLNQEGPAQASQPPLSMRMTHARITALFDASGVSIGIYLMCDQVCFGMLRTI